MSDTKTGDAKTEKKHPGADLTLEQIQALVTRAPFHKWLGLNVIAVGDDWIEIKGSNSFYDDDLSGLMTMIQQGRIKPVIDKVLPLEQAAEGLRLIQDREVIGKVVVTP